MAKAAIITPTAILGFMTSVAELLS